MTQERGPGDLIDNRFRLIERLGSGAMGAVWRALDEVLQREVALKEVRPADPGLLADPDFAQMLRTRVLREAQALARIDHPHVVAIHNIVDVPGELHPWLVMELVRGGTLDDRLAAGPMAPAEVAAMGRGLLGALRAAHAAGICHRDVKPANVLLRPDGRPVLTDFGIADLADTSRLTMTGELTGSPAYIAPERLHGKEGNPASDLWSLGMLLYVAVEGVHPLRRSTAVETLAAVMSGVVPAATRAGALGPALEAVLVADPAHRATAEQLDPLLARALLPNEPGAPESSGPGLVASSAGSPGPAVASGGSPAEPSLSGHPADSAAVSSSATTQRLTVEPPPRQRRRRPRAVAWAVIGTLVLALIAGAASAGFVLVPRFQAALAGQPSGGTEPTTSTEVPEPVNLHTEDGMEELIKVLEEAAGTTEFNHFIVYEDSALASVPVDGDPESVDTYLYRDGTAELWQSGPGEPDARTVDVSEIDWDVLPKLLSRAGKNLKTDKSTSREVWVEYDPFYGTRVIKVLLSGKAGNGGRLIAHLNGEVIDIIPSE
ncbi:serine/threonine-protein kinase [Microlunatus parietis]|uniref:non-specific serine/threonine protein kinase n=1 Tax=Microlunatus parietis TaxID=682979 RepID=A0A7Y9LB90_9ACTN|nr:serine/threonine-protein kinase [Microlunatus parietis]NYE69571.1 serine/threonine protein kinase [Microlunatus parietis]